MRLVLVSDSHYGATYRGRSFTPDTHQALMAAVRFALQNQADYFIHCGDLGHQAEIGNEERRLLTEVFDCLESGAVQFRCLSGNHDWSASRRDCLLQTFSKSYRYGRMLYDSSFVVEKTPEALLCYAPWRPPSLGQDLSTSEALQKVLEQSTTSTLPAILMFSHFDLAGARVHWQQTSPVYGGRLLYPEKLLQLTTASRVCRYNGHYHIPQQVQGVQMVGSISRFSFRDGEHHGFWEVSVSQGQIIQHFHTVASRPFIQTTVVVGREALETPNYEQTLVAPSSYEGAVVQMTLHSQQLSTQELSIVAQRVKRAFAELPKGPYLLCPLQVASTFDRTSSSSEKQLVSGRKSQEEIIKAVVEAEKPKELAVQEVLTCLEELRRLTLGDC